MTRTPSCPYEGDVSDLLWTGSWPSRADDALREHVTHCPVCRDLSTVALALAELDEASRAGLTLPDASLVWYRAEVRARQARTRRAARPLLAAELVSAILLLAGALVAWRSASPSLAASWRGLTGVPDVGWPSWSDLAHAFDPATWIWMGTALGALALLAPTAFFIARMADLTPDAPGGRLTAPPVEHPDDR